MKLEAPEQRQPALKAFSLMMSSQQQICSQQYPSPIEHPRNKKEELSNAVLEFFKREKLCWMLSEVAHVVAVNTVRTLTDVLWFLDGHQATFHECSCETRAVFNQFVAFNRPELAKHRKRSSASLSSKCGWCMCIHVCTCTVCTICMYVCVYVCMCVCGVCM